MAIIQQHLLHRRLRLNGTWTVTQDDDLPTVNGTRALTANRTTTNKWTILGQGDMSGGGDEQSQINSTNNGVSWSESGISQVGYGNDAYESPKKIMWNGSTSSPRWMSGNVFYPDSDTTTSGGSKPTILTTTNLTSWSRLLLPIDNTYGTSTINQGIEAVAYNNGTWAAINSASGNCTTSSNNGSSWSSYAVTMGGYIPCHTIIPGASGEFVAAGQFGKLGYSSNSGSSFTVNQLGPVNSNKKRWLNGNYFTYPINVGNTKIGPNVWVFYGSQYYNAYTADFEILCYSTNGTSWTELNVNTDDSNQVTNRPYPGTRFDQSWRTILDTGEGLWLQWLKNDGTWQLWGSYHSLTDWFYIIDEPSGSYFGSDISWLNRDWGFDYWNRRLVNGSNSGHICYLDFTF